MNSADANSQPLQENNVSAMECGEPSASIKLRRPPFDNTRDSNYFFPSSGHAEALSRLAYLIADRNMGIGLLTGEIGCGKTITSSVLRQRLKQEANHVVNLENGLLDFDGLLLEIVSQMRGTRVLPEQLPDRYTRLAMFKQTLMRNIVDQKRHLVIVIDEAQQLQPATIDQLKGLTNIGSERQNFISLVFIAQPEFRVTMGSLPQVDQRVSLRYHLNALSLEETRQYLRHRLTVAGLHSEYPFEPDAELSIYNSSHGVPREINRMCKLALEHAHALAHATISTDTIDTVLADLRRHSGTLHSNEQFQ
jgi:general secretion pathway protein A